MYMCTPVTVSLTIGDQKDQHLLTIFCQTQGLTKHLCKQFQGSCQQSLYALCFISSSGYVFTLSYIRQCSATMLCPCLKVWATVLEICSGENLDNSSIKVSHQMPCISPYLTIWSCIYRQIHMGPIHFSLCCLLLIIMPLAYSLLDYLPPGYIVWECFRPI